MVKIGWMQDSHTNDGSTSQQGVTGAMATDANTLANTYNVSDIYFAGDLVAPNGSAGDPHAPSAYFNQFWSEWDAGANSDLLKFAIPGNHDAPLANFLESDSRAVLRARVDYPDDNVTVCLINTHTNGFATGGPEGSTGNSGLAQNVPACSYRDLKWLDEQLADAGTNAKVVIPHAGLFPINSPQTTGRTHDLGGDASTTRGNIVGDTAYEIVENCSYAHSILASYSKVVVPTSHFFQQFGQGTQTVDGVDYVYKKHYYDPNQTANASTFGLIDVTDSGVTIKTVEHSDGTEYTPLDKTF